MPRAKMPMKQWFQKLQPIQLYIILFLTLLFFITELVFSHITHSLTLLMDSYHMLCNILALTGCLITIKSSNNSCDNPRKSELSSEEFDGKTGCSDKKPNETKRSPTRTNQESKLRNTFGWARIDVLSLLVYCIFMASLSFSVFAEAMQTLVHINHFDEMHHPLAILFIGSAGMILNGICYLLIGGYTFHQGSFLFVTESGDVILDKIVVSDVKQGGRRLSRTRSIPSPIQRQRQSCVEMCRDVIGCVYVIICALVVYFTREEVAKYVDPIISVFSAASLMILSYPHMKESCLILLQTLPDTINIDILRKDLLDHFPDIVNIHDFHVWQLTATKIISTVHIIFKNEKGYNDIMENVREFLLDNGITQVTIQPEFDLSNSSEKMSSCLMQCQGEDCQLNHCCPSYDEKKSVFKNIFNRSKQTIVTASLPNLTSVKRIHNDFSKTTDCLTTEELGGSADNVKQVQS